MSVKSFLAAPCGKGDFPFTHFRIFSCEWFGSVLYSYEHKQHASILENRLCILHVCLRVYTYTFVAGTSSTQTSYLPYLYLLFHSGTYTDTTPNALHEVNAPMGINYVHYFCRLISRGVDDVKINAGADLLNRTIGPYYFLVLEEKIKIILK